MMPSRLTPGSIPQPPRLHQQDNHPGRPANTPPHRPKKEEDDLFGSMKEAKKTKKKTPPIDRPKKRHSKPALTCHQAAADLHLPHAGKTLFVRPINDDDYPVVV
jgi:hypothetical protein